MQFGFAPLSNIAGTSCPSRFAVNHIKEFLFEICITLSSSCILLTLDISVLFTLFTFSWASPSTSEEVSDALSSFPILVPYRNAQCGLAHHNCDISSAHYYLVHCCCYLLYLLFYQNYLYYCFH